MNELDAGQNQPLTIWTQRLEELGRIERETGVAAHTSTALEPEGNVLWMLEIERWKSALDLMAGNGVLTCAMANHFDEVVYLDTRASMAAFAQRRFEAEAVRNVTIRKADPDRLPYDSESFDWIAAQDILDALAGASERDSPRRILKAVLKECRRVLRPGGGLYLRAANSLDFAARRRLTRLFSRSENADHGQARAAASPRFLERALREAGFRDVRLYYVAPSREWPMALIPATRSTVQVYESRGHFVTRSGRLRRLAARVGLHASLFDAVVALGYL